MALSGAVGAPFSDSDILPPMSVRGPRLSIVASLLWAARACLFAYRCRWGQCSGGSRGQPCEQAGRGDSVGCVAFPNGTRFTSARATKWRVPPIFFQPAPYTRTMGIPLDDASAWSRLRRIEEYSGALVNSGASVMMH